MKKAKLFFSLTLCVLLLVSTAAPAFAAPKSGRDVPNIHVRGMAGDLVNAQGEVISDRAFPEGGLAGMVKDCMPSFLNALKKNDQASWDAYRAKLFPAVKSCFGDMWLDNNGEASDGERHRGPSAPRAFAREVRWPDDAFERAYLARELLLPPGVVSERDRVRPCVEQPLCERGGESRAGRAVLRVHDNRGESELAPQTRYLAHEHLPPWASHDVSYHQHLHLASSVLASCRDIIPFPPVRWLNVIRSGRKMRGKSPRTPQVWYNIRKYEEIRPEYIRA